MDNHISGRADRVRSALERFEGPLTRYAASITGDIERARDVVQDTFVRLCDEEPGRLNGCLAQWLFTVCRNRALDVQRKEQRMIAGCPEPSRGIAEKARRLSVVRVSDGIRVYARPHPGPLPQERVNDSLLSRH
jgi:DNA-directed RNA polymerase specialized sigma24 family protein